MLDLATARYEGGATTYLDVITAQQALLARERLAAQLLGSAPADVGVPGQGAGRRLGSTGAGGRQLRLEVVACGLSSSSCLADAGQKDEPMTAPRTESLQSRLETLIALARLLERVDASPVAIGAGQYRALVGQLKAALAAPLPAPPLEAILKAHPATAEIYENMNYEISGLSRSPLERSVATEMLATQLIHRIARTASRG